MRPRRIPKGNYGLVTTVGTTFYVIIRLCFTADALTHLPDRMRDVYRFITRRHLFVITNDVVFLLEKHELVIDIVRPLLRKGEG